MRRITRRELVGAIAPALAAEGAGTRTAPLLLVLTPDRDEPAKSLVFMPPGRLGQVR